MDSLASLCYALLYTLKDPCWEYLGEWILNREMEYIERASFVEIYGLKLAYPISLLSQCFDFFKAHNILSLFRYQWFWCLF